MFRSNVRWGFDPRYVMNGLSDKSEGTAVKNPNGYDFSIRITRNKAVELDVKVPRADRLILGVPFKQSAQVLTFGESATLKGDFNGLEFTDPEIEKTFKQNVKDAIIRAKTL